MSKFEKKYDTNKWGTKIVFLVLVLALMTFVTSFASANIVGFADDNTGQSSQATSDAGIKLVDKGKLTIANSPDYPPFSELSGDDIVGFEPSIWNEIASRLGLTVQTKILNFDAILPAVASGTQCDIGMSGISVDPQRAETVDFSDSYYTADISFAVAENSQITKANAKYKLYDSSLRFAVQSGTTAETYVRENFPKATCMAYSNANDCFSAVVADQADVVCSTSAVTTNLLKASYSSMQVVLNIATGEEYAIAVSKDNPALTSAINKCLQEMKADGTLQKIAAHCGLDNSSNEKSNTLQTVKCTAKTNSLASNDILTDKETRITWEAQAGEIENLKSLEFNLPKDVEFSVSETVTTILSGEDLLNRTVLSTNISQNENTLKIDFTDPTQVKVGAYYRVEIYGVFIHDGGDHKISGAYTLSDNSVKPINDIPDLVVVKQGEYQKFAESLNDLPAIKAWNSNKFCNLFLNPSIFLLSIPIVFSGFLMALAIVLCAFPLALPLGLCFALMRISRFKILRGIASVYVNVVRGTPLFLQIYIAFFGLPLAGINVPNFLLGLIVLALNSSAYMCEIFRAGIQSISRGQFEASRSLGLSQGKTMFYIIVPQAISRCIPTLTSEFILLYKDTSLLASVGVMEVVMFAKTIVASTGSITPYIVAALFYLVITLPAAKIVGNIEAKMTKRHAVKKSKKQKKDLQTDKSVDVGAKVFPERMSNSNKDNGSGISSSQMGSF